MSDVLRKIIPAERLGRIARLVNQNGSARVDELSDTFGVSVITIRRDLEILERQGLLEKTHGGAIGRTLITDFPGYTAKQRDNRSEKAAIGRRAAALIEPGETVFVGAGTTATQVLLALKDAKNLRIVTNNISGISQLHDSSIEVIVLGGVYEPREGITVGEFQDEMLANILVGKAIIGVDGLSFKSGLSSPNVQESAIARKIMAHTEGKIIVVTDHTKVGRRSNFSFATLNDIDILVTDDGIDRALVAEIEKIGVQVIIAETEKDAD